MKNNRVQLLIGFSFALILAWIAYGVKLFYFTQSEFQTWQIGELGDYVGGGLGGIAVIGVIYTIWLQGQQLEDQKIQDSKAATLRLFELLKPEIENLSVRVISKIPSSELQDDETIEEMHRKFRENDRTVFLRAMQKIDPKILEAKNNIELDKAITRFKTILEYLRKQLDSGSDDDGFSDAIRQTEIYQTYSKCFPHDSNNTFS
jgi:hypothetical protein